MSYGNGKERKDWLLRALPLAIGSLTATKQTALLDLNTRVLSLMRLMATQTFVAEPLLGLTQKEEVDAALLTLQKSVVGLNACWAEQARTRVKAALSPAYTRYFKKLVGRLLFVESLCPVREKVTLTPTQLKQAALFCGPPKPPRIYLHVPRSVQAWVTADELKALAATPKALDLFRQVILRHDKTGLTSSQVAIVRDIHERVQAQHTCPNFGAQTTTTVQLHLDYRMLPTVRRKKAPNVPSVAMNLRGEGEAYLLRDDQNVRYQRFLDIAGVAPHAPRIRIPVILTKKIARRLKGTRTDWASLILELSTNAHGSLIVGARLVCGRPAPLPILDVRAVTTTVGRDFGFTETINLSVVTSSVPVDLSQPEAWLQVSAGRTAARRYFETHVLPDSVQLVEQKSFSGKRFLDRLSRQSKTIDRLTQSIDQAYPLLHEQASLAKQALGLSPTDRILPEHHPRHATLLPVQAFLTTQRRIQELKQQRRERYRASAALKKNWYGYLTTVEVNLAQAHGAAFIREALTLKPIETQNPNYKGRTFNKMLRNGAPGQYQRIGSAKLLWNGIPEIAIGSWYTSRACTTHARIVDPQHRQGIRLTLPCCQKTVPADAHASETLAQYPFLQPLSFICDTQAQDALGSTVSLGR